MIKTFTIARTKFYFYYLFKECDCNTDNPYGTAVPFKKIESASILKNKNEKLQYILDWRKKLSDPQTRCNIYTFIHLYNQTCINL